MRMNTNEVSTVVTSFPYKLQHLSSYTSFDVFIFHKHHKLFSQKIRTLEGGKFDYIFNKLKKSLFAYKYIMLNILEL